MISELGFLVGFYPKMVSEQIARLTYVFFADSDNSFHRCVLDYFAAHGANVGIRPRRMGIIFDDLMFPGFQTPGNPLPFPYILSQESPGLFVFKGIDPNGDWTLTITDIFPDSDVGILNEWSLDID